MDKVNSLINGSRETSTIDFLSGSIDIDKEMQNIGTSSGGFLSGVSLQTIMAGVIMGIIGVYFIKVGKKDGKIISLLCGIMLCVVPYFTQKIGYLIGAGIVLTGIPIITKR